MPLKSTRARSRSRTPGPSLGAVGPLTNGTPVGAKRSRAVTPSTPSKRRAIEPALNAPPAPFPPPQLPSVDGAGTASSSTASKRQLFVWGNGDMGQFGLGTDILSEIKRPRLHVWVEEKNKDGELGPQGIEMIAAGGMHTVAVDSRGYIYTWGINDNAALGRRTDRDPNVAAEELETEPTRVEGLSPTGTGIIGGEGLQGGKEGLVEKFRATRVAASSGCGVALNEAGELRIWGSFRSNEGLLGFEATPGAEKLQYLPGPIKSLQKIRFAAVTCGEDHVLALTLAGQVYTWGNGQQGQLGRRVIERRKINALVPSKLDIKNAVAVGAGSFHSFAVDKDGQVHAWGLNTFGQLGLEPKEDLVTSPVVIDELSPEHHGGARVIQIEAGEHFSLFLFDNGEVWGSGKCDAGQLGIDEDHPAKQAILKAREEWRERRKVEFEAESAAYKTRMEAKEAQAKASGQPAGALEGVLSSEDMPPVMGLPPSEFVFEPVHIPMPGASKIAQISCGARYSIAVAQDGKAYSWGTGVNAELGQGDEEEIEVPTLLQSKTLNQHVALSASAGGQHALLLGVAKA